MNRCEPKFGWFGAGWASYKGRICSDFLPPLNNLEAQHEWLNGFCMADTEYNLPIPERPLALGESIVDYVENCEWTERTSLEEELEKKLVEYPELLGQLKSALVHEGN
jgi:hypothetical protein